MCSFSSGQNIARDDDDEEETTTTNNILNNRDDDDEMIYLRMNLSSLFLLLLQLKIFCSSPILPGFFIFIFIFQRERERK